MLAQFGIERGGGVNQRLHLELESQLLDLANLFGIIVVHLDDRYAHRIDAPGEFHHIIQMQGYAVDLPAFAQRHIHELDFRRQVHSGANLGVKVIRADRPHAFPVT
ncbi:MAG: hypothetical protein HYS65_10840 [Betaproteobacteria bacterium]|nr:hypothetical protein [Betaproteobacteria bacterium]